MCCFQQRKELQPGAWGRAPPPEGSSRPSGLWLLNTRLRYRARVQWAKQGIDPSTAGATVCTSEKAAL